MKRFFLSSFTFVMMMFNIISFLSCNDPEDIIVEKQEKDSNKNDNNGKTDNTSSNNTGTNSTDYYFWFNSISGMDIGPNSGSSKIYFECNQEWNVSYSGNISGFRVSPTSGEGNGYIVITYSETQYKTYSNRIEWNESEEIRFQIKEGNSKNYKNTTKSFYVQRRGSKIKV